MVHGELIVDMKTSTESFLVRAYGIKPPKNVSVKEALQEGNDLKKKLKFIDTPQSTFNVRIWKSHYSIQYFLYDKESDECVGWFQLVTIYKDEVWKEPVKPGVFVLEPSVVISPELQGKGYGKMLYKSFLAGNRVFFTTDHTKAASNLWDSLSRSGPLVSFFYDQKTKRVVEKPVRSSIRYLGHKKMFKPDILSQLRK